MGDQFDLYRAERLTPTPEERRLDRPTDPRQMAGYWRVVRAKTRHDTPIMIWTKEGEEHTVYQRGTKRGLVNSEWGVVGGDAAGDQHYITSARDFTNKDWLKCIAVTKADWASAIETGKWPDGKPARQMGSDEKLGIDTGSGSNDAPIEELLEDQIAALADKLEKVKEPTSQVEADALTGDLDRMRGLLNKAKAVREEEYRPHKEAADAVSIKWAEIMKPGQDAGTSAEAKRKAYLKKEQQRLDDIAAEERRQREEEARKAAQAERERLQKEADARAADERERRRIEAEAAAKRAEEARVAAEADAAKKAEADRLAEEAKAAEEAAASVQTEIVAEPEVVVAPVETKRASAGTSFGRQSGLKKTKVGKIVNLAQMVNAMLFTEGQAPDAELMAYLQERATKAVKGGFPMPGTVADEEYR